MTIKELIKEFVDDHKAHFDCYPMEVEVNDVVYPWDQYWEILEKDGNVSYDFSLDSIVAVDAPIGTDPDTLIDLVKLKLIKRIQENDVTIVFENIFDSETGAYDEDWEGYTRKELSNGN